MSKPASRIALVASFIAFLAMAAWLNFAVDGEQQFSFLARAFLHGKLSFLDNPGRWTDSTLVGSKHYWPLGPLPALVLVPLVCVGETFGFLFYQGYLQFFLVLAVLFLVYLSGRRTGFAREDSAYLAFGFCFATAFLGVAMWPWSWYFAHVLTCALLFAVIYEMNGERRPWVLGSLFGLTMMTRVPAALGIAWCVGETLVANAPRRNKITSLAGYLIPCAAAAAGLLLYNFFRFNSLFEQGYSHQIIPLHAERARDYGIMTVRHLPSNLYFLFLAAPSMVREDGVSLVLQFPFVTANPMGMSIFLTSPCLFVLFTLRKYDTTCRLLALTAVAIATPILLYYGIGYRQFGYRYSLDFLPFVYYLLMRGYYQTRQCLSPAFKTLLVASALANLYLFAGHFLPLLRW